MQQTTPSNAYEILSVTPEFETFPPDAEITTAESLDPTNTGMPVGRAYCRTPFETSHVDDAAELVSCGVWTIKRHWFIRPKYDGCQTVTDPRLVVEKIQIITVKDVFQPDFITTPAAEVDVDFLKDYRPNAVGYPTVQDRIYHQIRAVDGLFRFVSYNVTIEYDDVVTLTPNPFDVCQTGALSTVTRTKGRRST